MTKLRIAPELALPLDAVTETIAVLAKRGAGKTYTASVLAEEMLKAKLHVAVLDPMGAWWGLRTAANGKDDGFSIAVIGGAHGDVPLEATGGSLVADLMVDESLSAIVDVSDFSKTQRRQFVTDFLERLYQKNREPMHLFVEEADMFAPQSGGRGQEENARMLGAMYDIVRRGRGRGIGSTLITQRSASISKEVLEQAEILVALRTTGPRDRKAIEGWIDVHGDDEDQDKVMGSLPSLPTGTAWVWWPVEGILKQVRVRERQTFDSSATPKVGQKQRRIPKTVAEVDLSALQERMAATIEKAKAEDPRELRRQVAELRKQLAARPKEVEAAAVPEAEAVEIPVPMLEEKQVRELRALLEELRATAKSNQDVVAALSRLTKEQDARDERLGKALERVAEGLEGVIAAADRRVEALRRPAPPRSAPRPRTPPRESPPVVAGPDGQVQLKKGARTMLEVLARHYPMKVTRAQLGTLARLSARGGTFSDYLSKLRISGLIEEADGVVQLSEAGLAYAGHIPQNPMSTAELLAQWRSALKAGARRMLDILVEAYPDALSREKLGETAGIEHTGGTFGDYLSTLRRNGLIEDLPGAAVRASDSLFLAEPSSA